MTDPTVVPYPTQLQRSIDDLAQELAGTFSRETVARIVLDSHSELSRDADVHAFTATLAQRFARDRLHATACVVGRIAHGSPEVLFICVRNAGRSQMAAALLQQHAQGRLHARSAGSMPANEVDPAVVEAMSELGIDISQAFPKPLTDEIVRDADAVVTMGCGDACPVLPGKRYLDWNLKDPAGRSVEDIRVIRDEIDDRVRTLVTDLLGSNG